MKKQNNASTFQGRLDNFFAFDGKFMAFMNTTGELVMLSAVCILCCLPIITIIPAVTSLYYAVIKSVRRGRGAPVKEFFHSMKRSMAKGCLMNIGLLIWGVALYFGHGYTAAVEGEMANLAGIYLILAALTGCALAFLCPVLSRFEMKITAMIKLSFIMSIRFLPITVVILAGTVFMGWLQIYILPMACIFVVPGVWCYALTFLVEKVLLRFMPKPKEGENAWYYPEEKEKEEGRHGNEENFFLRQGLQRRKEVKHETI